MDNNLARLPSPIAVSHDTDARLLNLEKFLLTVCQSHEKLHNRVVTLVSSLTDLRKTAITKKEKILEKKLAADICVPNPSECLWRLLPLEPIPNNITKREKVTLQLCIEATGEVRIPPNEAIIVIVRVMNCTQSRIIDSNETGESILSGGVGKAVFNTARNVHTAQVAFRLNEVSSFFEDGCVALVVQAKCPNNMELQQLIQPYVVEGLVVRPKDSSCRKDRATLRR